MAYIRDVNITSGNTTTQYLIEPTLYGAASTTDLGATYNVTIDNNFALVNGVAIQVKFSVTNKVNATLQANSTGAKNIYYNNAQIAADTLKANHTYTFVYDGTQWQLVGDIDTNTTYTNGTGLNLNGTTFSVKYGTEADTAAQGNDSRLSDARTPKSHTHGNIQNDGTLGTANVARAVVTNASNQITTDNFAQDSPTVPASGATTSLEFIDTVSQGASGKITATKKKIPNVSKDTAGLAPKGAAVSTQSQSTKFLREDGSWAAPTYTSNTDQKVKQNANTENKEYSILLKTTDDATGETGEVKFGATTNKLVTINPSTGKITAPGGLAGDASSVNGHTVLTNVPANAVFTDTNKYHKTGSWNDLTYTATAVNSADELKFTIPTGTTGTTVALGNHTHTLNIATDTGTTALTFAANTKYKLTAGGNSYIFTTQSDAYRLNQSTLDNTAALSSFTHASALIYTAKGGSNTITDKPTGVDAFGVLSFKTADGWYGQLLMSSNNSSGIYWRTATALSGGWKTLLDSGNTTAPASVPTLSWNSESTVFTLNGSAIKIKAMAKPTYAFTDLTAHPTTISGYGITDAKIASGVITLGSSTITPVTSVNGHTGSSVSVTAGDLGLASALRFIGKTTSTMVDGFTGTPAGISGYSTPIVGDVVLDSSSDAEYVCISKNGTTYTWELLGRDGSWSLSDHVHGNLTNAGTLTSTTTIANGDKLVIVDVDNTAASKITGTTITFDGSTATKALTQKGTWETFNNYSHPTGDGNLHVPANGTGNNGKFLQATATAGSYQWASVTKSTVGLDNVTNDKQLPLAGGTMTGDITFTATTFSSNPTDSKGLVWSGGTDSAKIFYRQTANNAGSLVLQVSDDGEEYINFRHTAGGMVYLKPNTREFYPNEDNKGSIGTSSYKWANMYATTFNGNATSASTVTTTADTSNTLYPLGVTNNATTTIKRDTSITMNNGTITATEFVGAIKSNKITPAVSKTYSDNSFYGTSDAEATCSKFFISVKPDGWYKPWQVRFKVRTYAPAHVNADSVTWCTLNGRADGLIYANWNERYDIGHYYVVVRVLKNAGFNAGLGHAVGVNIRYSTGRGNSEYYKTIELEYYDCSGCTVTVLDNAVLWANWTNGSDTNYNGYSNLDAVNRGLRETADDNDYTTIRSYYDRITAGTGGLMAYSLAMKDSSGKWQSFTTTSGTGTTKTKNTAGFILGEIVYLNMSGNVTNGNVVGWNVTARYQGLINYQYSTNAGGTLTSNLMLYIVGSINANDGLFYLDDTWWTTTLPTTENGKIYIPVGIIYPDTAGSTYRCDFSGWHTPLQYINGKLRSYEMSSFNTIQTFYKGLEVKGHIAGDSGSTGHGLYNGGLYHNAYNNIILHGDNSTGSSGIAFVSDKVNNSTGVITNINQPSDRAFIQYHACGVTTATAEGTAPTIATSGEAGRLVIGIGNDSGDKIILQAPGTADIIHQLGANGYPIPHTTNTNGSVGGTTTPVYVESGVIKACTAYSSASVNYATSTGKATNDSDGNAINTTYLKKSGGTMTGALKFSGDDSRALTWEDGTWYQRILTTDDSTANTAVFTFQQSNDSGTNWSDLFTIKDNGGIVAGGGIGVANTTSTTGIGISLYNGATTGAPTYGIMFAGTGTFGTHGAVTSDWATYFTMSDTTNRGWIFRRGSTNVCSIDGTGKIYLGYAASTANPGIYWNPYVESASDGSDASAIYQIKAGVAGGTELRISQANDSTDVINIVSPYYIYMNSKRIFTINDSWFRINENSGFSSGVYFGSGTGGVVRTDNQFQVGDSGNKFYANSSGNGYFSNTLGVGGTNTNYKLYVNGTTGSTEYVVNAKVRLEWNATDLSLDFVFV